MKKTLVIGSLVAVFLMTMIPVTSAINSQIAKEELILRSSLNVPEVDAQEIKARFLNNPDEPTPILITLLIWLLKLIRIGLVVFWGVVFIIIRRFGNSTAVS